MHMLFACKHAVEKHAVICSHISIVNKNIRVSNTHVFFGEINISIVNKNIRVVILMFLWLIPVIL